MCWSIKNTPTIGDNKTLDGAGAGNFVSTITELVPNTTYFVRAYATNSSGIGYGMAMSFITQPATIPVLTTTNITSITQTSASCGGTITSDGAVAITTRGVCWSTSQNPTITDNITSDGNGIGIYSSTLNGLIQNTTYFVRAYATNSAGTGYGNTLSFATQDGPIIFNPNLTYGTVTDIDGNEYKTITIGAQTWMAENLKTSKYSNGTDIQYVNTVSEWDALAKDSKAYCWNFDNINNKNIYGALYTWTAAMNGASSSSSNPSGVHGVCPTGWHLPSDAEWHSLVLTLDPNSNLTANPESSIAGGKMKETGTFHWKSPNTDATNESGFTALPGNLRDTFGKFTDITFAGQEGFWWSSTIYDTEMAYHRSIYYYFGNFRRGDYYYQSGMSVRCVKDN